MQLCKYTAQEAGLVPCPNLALDWVYPLPLHATTPVSLGQPWLGPRSSGLVRLGQGLLHKGWLV